MCGIFGIALTTDAKFDKREIKDLLANLFVLSESRGKESAGLHLYSPVSGNTWTLKCASSASELLKLPDYTKFSQEFLNPIYKNSQSPSEPLIIFGHSRLVTNGTAALGRNNQPVRYKAVTMIHNGICVNVDALWASNDHLKRCAEVDTEVMAAMVADGMDDNFNPIVVTQQVFGKMKGAASIAWVHDQADTLTLATNTGDLYFILLPNKQGLIFASERFILENAIKGLLGSDEQSIEWLLPRTGLVVQLSSQSLVKFQFDTEPQTIEIPRLNRPATHIEESRDAYQEIRVIGSTHNEKLLRYNENLIKALKRCNCCILPETFPYIEFDEAGVCNYCHNYKPRYKHMHPVNTKQEFIRVLDKYRRNGNVSDALVPFSGGRDSSYGLHLIYKEFGFKPITFTYDWGMVTDLARRNIARMCGQLGVQNILVSADIKTKRENIRKNVVAWLKKPDLGMVPLFMAGDKHFFKIVNQLKKQTGIPLDLWCANPLENTDFKSGFCGIKPDFNKNRVDYLSFGRKAKLVSYYAAQFIKNMDYLNNSLLDTFNAYRSYYLEPRKDFYFIFDHFIWNENEVNQTLLAEYDWEISPDSPSTWRIGDGTAPFYNYIYMTACGFSEFDTFRSNQIREGMITREEALDSIIAENRPRIQSLKWYLDTINLDFNDVMTQINRLDTRGLHH